MMLILTSCALPLEFFGAAIMNEHKEVSSVS